MILFTETPLHDLYKIIDNCSKKLISELNGLVLGKEDEESVF
jgi:hypothetical protein